MDLANDNVIHYTFSYAFVVNGFLCALVIGPLLGGIGTMVVAKRMAFFSQAVGNAALTGVAIGVIIGESYTAPYVSMFSFCLLFGMLLNFARNRTKMSVGHADRRVPVDLARDRRDGAAVGLGQGQHAHPRHRDVRLDPDGERHGHERAAGHDACSRP